MVYLSEATEVITMARYRVPQGQRGAGKMFVNKGAYVEWCNREINHEKNDNYTVIEPTNYIARKMLGKTQHVSHKRIVAQRRPARFS